MRRIGEGKIRSAIDRSIKQGIKLFVIYPYGKRGKFVKKVLNQSYGIKELAIVDNLLSKSNEEILSVEDLAKIHEDYVILLSSDNREVWDEVRQELGGALKEKVIDLAEEEAGREGFDLIGERMEIDVCNVEQRKKIFERTKGAWKKLGEEEPYWSVITHDKFKMENVNKDEIKEFYADGQQDMRRIASTLIRNRCVENWDKLKTLKITEIGCGCGRVTKHLAQYFEKVLALDISPGNLKIAQEEVKNENVEFRLIKQLEDYENMPEADIIYSYLVLQHNCPPVIEYLLQEMLRSVKVGGFAFFQVPTYKRDYCFAYKEYIENDSVGMEMHLLSQDRIFQIAYEFHCIPMEVYADNSTGQDDNSTWFVLKKIQ